MLNCHSVPYIPVSHPFIERLIGTIRREYLDRTFFWNALDLTRKLEAFKAYYNGSRCHQSLSGGTPLDNSGTPAPQHASLLSSLTIGGDIAADSFRRR